MKDELENKFKERWPTWFAGLRGSPMETCLAFGFECGDGWYDLLWRLCEDIERIGPGEDFRVLQVKEKFGGLRFYIGAAPREVHDRIDLAEQESYDTCEICGTKENVTSEGAWISTLCGNCRKPRNDRDD